MLKEGDIVFMKTRNPIEWDVNVINLNMNTTYSISYVGDRSDGSYYVTLYGNERPYHINRFKLAEGEYVQGHTILAIGTEVKYIGGEKIGWERHSDSAIYELSKLVIGNTYTICKYVIYGGHSYVKLSNSYDANYVHSAHFKKIV